MRGLCVNGVQVYKVLLLSYLWSGDIKYNQTKQFRSKIHTQFLDNHMARNIELD